MAGFNSWRVSTRIYLLIGLTLVGLLTLSSIALTQIKANMLEDRKAKTKNLVELSLGIVEHNYKLAQAGTINEDEAKRVARESLRNLRYGPPKDYIFIVDTNHHYVLLPPNAAFEGQDKKDMKDASGQFLIQEVVKKGIAGDFVYYWFPRPGQQQPETKIAYVELFKPWGWVVGTGIYIDDIDTEFRHTAILLGGISTLLIVLLVVLGWLIARGILRQLGGEPTAAVSIMQRVADGDLTAAVGNTPPGSLLNALGGMIASLHRLISEINRSATTIANDAKLINGASVEVTAAATRQSDATSAMAAAIEELTVSSTHISDNARDTENDSQAAMTLAGEGSERVEAATSAIRKIAGTVNDVSDRIRALEGRAGEISSIANVIKEIAGQTNLLALNAAIEAARAGEQGRGFAVVADEVRKLAERTSSATTEIEQMILGIQNDTRGAVGAIKDALPEVEQGVQLAGSASESLQAIEQGAQRTLERIHEMASATQEQGSASTSIAQRVEQIAQMVEETTAAVHRSAATADQLEKIANSLQTQTSHFRV